MHRGKWNWSWVILAVFAMGCSDTSNTGTAQESGESVLQNEETEGSSEGVEPVVCPGADSCDDANVCTKDELDEDTCICSNTPLIGSTCNDDNACTENDVCSAKGECSGSTINCSDDDPCTTDDCDSFTGCSYGVQPDGTTCNDGNPCTLNDLCTEGVCGGEEIPCEEDDNACTTLAGCDPETGECNFINVADDTFCDDGNACTAEDHCELGECVSSIPTICDDGNDCTDNNCTPKGGCTFFPNTTFCDDESLCTTDDKCSQAKCVGAEIQCDDGNACTSDGCDPEVGCSYTPIVGPCEDGNPCTLNDLCEEGQCQNGVKKDCNDDDACTTEYCDLNDGSCVFEYNTKPCDDNDACTSGDACANGVCEGTESLICNDDNPCTTDSCDKDQGCIHAPNTASCDDGNSCTIGDLCNEGACDGGSPKTCTDDNPCTDDDCEPETGCSYAPNTNPCDDGDACTETAGDLCVDGTCTSGETLQCDDENPCTDDSCDPQTGCVNTPNALSCDDGNACSTGDSCSDTVCSGKSALECDDANSCTDDNCDPETGCTYAPNTNPCDDGDACTETNGDLCVDGTCTSGELLQCNDENPCTDDSCDPQTGCVNTPNALSCDDGNACTVGDACSEGVCVSGAGPDCNDSNPCTEDTCAPETGCVYAANAAVCEDGDTCTEGDVCENSVCSSGSPVSCDDGNPCTDDSCDPLAGCAFVANGVACDDGNACTQNDICTASACESGAAVVCEDGNACTSDSCGAETGCIFDDISSTCSDGIQCTVDSCDPQSGCVFTPDDTVCASGELCITDTCDVSAGCVSDLTPQCCGNGLIEAGEDCDDGNLVEGDGCDSGCIKESSCPSECLQGTNLVPPAAIKVSPMDGGILDSFGTDVASSNNRLAVGSPNTGINNSGSIYVYVWKGTEWLLEQKVEALDGSAYDYFGNSLSLSGDTLAVGVSASDVSGNDNSGCVYIFERVNGVWTQQQKIVLSNGEVDDHFGAAVELHDNLLAVGASGVEMAYLFSKDGDTWTLQQEITPILGASGDKFGASISLSGDRLAVGAYSSDENATDSGSVHLYALKENSWVAQQKVIPQDGEANDYFGRSISISAETLSVGAYSDNNEKGSSSGSVYVFEETGNQWIEKEKITAVDGSPGDNFGWSVALHQDMLVIGAPFADPLGNDSGRAYLYSKEQTGWKEKEAFEAPDGLPGAQFGRSVDLLDDMVTIGASQAKESGVQTGGVYIYDLSTSVPLCNPDNTCSCLEGWSGPDCSESICGDGVTVGDEECDDGNTSDEDGCSSGCQEVCPSTCVPGHTQRVFDYKKYDIGGLCSGAAIDSDGTRIAIGCANNSMVFHKIAGDWEIETLLEAGISYDNGMIQIAGDVIAIGAPGESPPGLGCCGNPGDYGTVYIYQRINNIWTETQKFHAPTPEPYKKFGRHLSLSSNGEHLVVRDVDHGYVYKRNNDGFEFVVKKNVRFVNNTHLAGGGFGGFSFLEWLNNSWTLTQTGGVYDQMGSSGPGGLDDNRAVLTGGSQRGAAVYQWTGEEWAFEQKLLQGFTMGGALLSATNLAVDTNKNIPSLEIFFWMDDQWESSEFVLPAFTSSISLRNSTWVGNQLAIVTAGSYLTKGLYIFDMSSSSIQCLEDGGCSCKPGYSGLTCSEDISVCGDGSIGALEECDDGNTEDGDGCSSTCVEEPTTCGDGIVDPGEFCDVGPQKTCRVCWVDDTGPNGTTVLDGAPGSGLGSQLAALGDWNGDGFDDFAASTQYVFGSSSPEVFVYFGNATGSFTSPTVAYSLITAQEKYGYFRSVGDVDGDGLTDIQWGPRLFLATDILMNPSGTVLNDEDASYTFLNEGNTNCLQPYSPQGHGDFDGDGLSDIVMNPLNSNCPEGGIFLGKEILEQPKGTAFSEDNARFLFTQYGSQNGYSGIGDIDGDGKEDLFLSGLESEEEHAIKYRKGYVFLSASLEAISLNGELTPAMSDYTLHAITENGYGQGGGWTTPVKLGDWDGDGNEDFALADYLARAKPNNTTAVGASFVFLSSMFTPENIGTTFTKENASFTIQGGQQQECLGNWGMLANAGDVDGDGLDDLLLGASQNSEGGQYMGKAYVVFASEVLASESTGFLDVAYDTDAFVFKGLGPSMLEDGSTGSLSAISPAGDLNNDGKPDLLLSSDSFNNNSGGLYLIENPF